MRDFVVFAVLALGSLGAARGVGAADVEPLDRCLPCHRLGGQGAAKGPDLLWTSGEWTRSGVIAQLWNHGDKMWERFEAEDGSPELGSDDFEAIFAALDRERRFAAEPAGVVAAGSRAFSQKRCAACHEAQGLGCSSGETLTLERFAAQLWRDVPKMKASLTKKEWPRLSGRDVRDLLAFCRQPASLKPPAR